ncbi:hypothetical protein F5Y10DRAFT_294522 [Nemania abortiva]|nr:hypothetical protein F5Y10DRAFT_294522 [Nemania abortiva]
MFRTTERLIPNLVGRLSLGDRRFATIVNIIDGNPEYQHLTFRDLDNASNKAAWFIQHNLKGENKLLYMGPNDIRYLIWVIAAMKTRKCVVLPSPGNTTAANISLFHKVGATTLLYGPEALDMLSPLLTATKDILKSTMTMSYTELLNDALVEPYPFAGTFDELQDRPFMGLHTSGTSGHPKPIYWNYSAAATIPSFLDPGVHDDDAHGPSALRELLHSSTVASFFPLFHFGGIAPLLASLHCDNTVVLLHPGIRPTPANVVATLELAKCTAAFIPPVILEAMVDYLPALRALEKLDFVGYAGGAVNPARGQELAKHIQHFAPILASTEGGGIHTITSGDSSCWNNFKFVDVGQRMEEIAPGFYELVFPRSDLVSRSNAFFHTYAHLETEYRTADLFSPVEGKDGWWIYRGRADNWMTLSTGLKMDPTDMENVINSHPDVRGALVAGSYRFRPCLLIELKNSPTDDTARALALDRLWPTITEANKGAPKLGRIPRELVIFASDSKPFSRAGKGTIQRALTVTGYSEEIDQAYDMAGEDLLAGGLPSLKSTEIPDIILLLRVLFSETIHGADGDFASDDDLLAHGLDSLGISVVVARLKATLRKYGASEEKLLLIKNQLIYKEATISRIASAISAILSSPDGVEEHAASTDQKTLDQLLQTYEHKLQAVVRKDTTHPTQNPLNGHTVVLTGSTGSIGSYILASLIARKDVKKIFCLNRGSDAPLKQAASFKSRGLPDMGADTSRVVFLQAALHEQHLGLPKDVYATLLHETTTIVHNAFPVNFLLGLRTFEPQLQALVNLLQLASSGEHNPAILFMSSISAGIPLGGHNSVIPEAVASRDDALNILQQGYAQSKYICERLLEKFSSLSETSKTAVLRVGQVCGPIEGIGIWNPSEWAPSLVISSKFIGACPKSIGRRSVDWVPIDKLGDIVSELISATSSQEAKDFTVYNVVNPHTTPWDDLLPALESIAPEAVEADEWIRRLEESDKGYHVINQNPALKLTDFYKQAMLGSQVEVSTEVDNLLGASDTAKNLPRVERVHLQRWMQGWGL